MQSLLEDCLKSGDTNRFLFSLKTFASPITDKIVTLDIPKCLPDDFRPTAVSCINYPFANVRHVTFLPPVDGQYRTKDGSPIQTENLYVNLESGELIVKMNDNTVNIAKRSSNVRGLEDIRLFTRDNKLKFIATSYREFCNDIGIITGDYNEDGTYSNCKALPSPLGNTCEKNWLPISGTDNFIYSWNPLRIIKESGEDVKIYNTPELFKLFRGSAPPILVDDKLICMIHIVEYGQLRKYYHAFVELDKNTYQPLRISQPFTFRTASIEYCVGMRRIESGFECYPTFMDSNPSRAIISDKDIKWTNIESKEYTAPKIGLCMIVKNEAHIICESLTATLPLIDTYCIVDTGSSDNTIEVIKKFYEDKGISGEVHEREWKNFGHNRSEALALCDGKMDYILVIDADDLITWGGDGKNDLINVLRTNPNCLEFNIRQGDLSYTRMQIFKANDGWKYVGVLHEYPTNGKPMNRIAKCPTTMYMTSRRLGGRNRVADKMKRDIAVLLKGVEEEPDNERYVFYLAQSYRDDGQIDEAVKWYKKRYEMGRWYEEQYISAYNIAKLTHDKEWAWKAHECNPKRIECLVSYLSYCRMTNKFSKELLAMAMYASSIKKPTDQHLFLENDVYDWKVWDELSIIAFYCGAKHIARMSSEKLISDNKAPPEQMARIKNNYKFSLPSEEQTNIIRVPQNVSVYWSGQYSRFIPNGEIESYLKSLWPIKFVLSQSDGFFGKKELDEVLSTTTETRIVVSSDDAYNKLNYSVKDGIVCTLATRGFDKPNILHLPLDDDTFKFGIYEILKQYTRPEWESRKPIAFWRGNLGGYERPSIREKVVSKLFENTNANVRFAFSGWNGEYSEKIDKKYVVDRCDLQNFFNYKYLLIIDGISIASNHQWIFASGSVPIMVTHPSNNWWFKKHLIPMENYVPIKYDLSDLEEKIDWLVNNDDLAKQIAINSEKLAAKLFTPQAQQEYIRSEVKRILNDVRIEHIHTER